MNTPHAYFDALYAHDDPYGYRSRWYEQRKRALVLACLPHPRYRRAWELGCSNGETSAALAPRCGALTATDWSARSIAVARRTHRLPNVSFVQAEHPAQWQPGPFDLIVFSEIGYFMTPATLETTIGKLRDSLAPDGVLLACHWRRPFDAAPLHGAQVHAQLRRQLRLPRSFVYRDADFVLEGWSAEARSVAQREGIA